MSPQFERPTDILGRLNRVLTPRTGLVVDCVLAFPGETDNFSRLTATPAQLDRSYGRVVRELRSAGIAVPSSYDPKARPLVNLSRGPGYQTGNSNNPAGMGLVLPHWLRGTAVGTTIADAPAAIVANARTGILAGVTGIWQQLALGTVDETIAMMELEARKIGESFDPADLWVIQSPGARADSFFIDAKGAQKLIDGGEKFTRGKRITRLEKPFIDSSSGKDREMTHALDLSGLYADLWKYADVPEDQVHLDPRNNMTYQVDGKLVLPSKRRAQAEGRPGFSSGILAAASRLLTPGHLVTVS